MSDLNFKSTVDSSEKDSARDFGSWQWKEEKRWVNWKPRDLSENGLNQAKLGFGYVKKLEVYLRWARGYRTNGLRKRSPARRGSFN